MKGLNKPILTSYINMAKPIRATPTLKGDDAIRFAGDMVKRERSVPAKFDRTIVRKIY